MDDDNSLSPFPLVEIKMETPDETINQESEDNFVNVKSEYDAEDSTDAIVKEEEVWSDNVKCSKEELDEIKRDSDDSDEGTIEQTDNFAATSNAKRSHPCGVCVGECKGKCKRLRSIFDTPGPSGFGLNTKPSFLSASDNLPDILQHEPDTFDDNAIEDCSGRACSTATDSEPSGRKRVADLNKSFVEYFQAKRASIAATQETSNEEERVDAAEHFLLSLLPELEAMTAQQIKTFKRKTFRIIDDIMKQSHSTHTHAISPISIHSSSSHLASDDTIPLDFVNYLPSEG